MGEGRKKGPGGGGASLNFTVKDYATEELLMAATGKVNEIGIITSTPMTGWHFAAEQPEMQPGEVWISTGTASPVAFSVLKKGGTVMVYPLSAKQMLEDGTLVNVTAKSWQGGEWIPWWNGELYDSGNQYEYITGGWVQDSNFHFSGHNDNGFVLSDSTMSYSGSSVAVIHTKNKINLAKFSKLHFDANTAVGGNAHVQYGIKSSYGDVFMSFDAVVQATASGRATLTINIENAPEEAYIVIAANNRSTTIYKIWLE